MSRNLFGSAVESRGHVPVTMTTKYFVRRTKLNDSSELCRTIQAREKLTLKLTEAERRLAELPGFRWVQRRRLRLRVASLHDEIADRNSKISDEGVRSLANTTGSNLWECAASEIVRKKNPYGPAARDRFGEIRNRALELARDYEVYDHHRRVSFPLVGMPEVKALITSSFLGSNALREINELAAIADSTNFIHKYDCDSQGKKTLRVQHVGSGLRAQFTLYGDGFGGVESKPYIVDSIDPGNPGMLHDWQRYVGLGIGRRIYEKAQRLEPDIRWGSSVLSDYSTPLRRKLHNSEPYVWHWSSCTWCDTNLSRRGVTHWKNAVKSTFDGHPHS